MNNVISLNSKNDMHSPNNTTNNNNNIIRLTNTSNKKIADNKIQNKTQNQEKLINSKSKEKDSKIIKMNRIY